MIPQSPYARLLGVAIGRDGDGRPLFIMPWNSSAQGRPDFLHGGAIGGLLEIAALGTLHDSLGNETGVTIKPINVTIDFMRGGRARETYASARIERIGNRIANLAAEAWQDDRDRPIAAARINVLLSRKTD